MQSYVTAGFFRKNPVWAKINKNGEKWPKNEVFQCFEEKKIISVCI